MSYLDINANQVVADAPELERARFIRNTYGHLAAAILAFVGLEALLFQSGIAAKIAPLMTGGYSWLIVMAGFMGVSYIADKWARSDISVAKQYLGLGLTVVAWSVMFIPMLYIAMRFSPDLLPKAALVTLALFGGLTFTAFTTRKNFSFLGPMLSIGSFVVLGIIVASIAFGFTLGIVFSGAMIIFAAGSILYSTSNIIHEYRPDQHVAASLSLFAAVALLFWYVLQFMMSLASD